MLTQTKCSPFFFVSFRSLLELSNSTVPNLPLTPHRHAKANAGASVEKEIVTSNPDQKSLQTGDKEKHVVNFSMPSGAQLTHLRQLQVNLFIYRETQIC